MAKETVNRQIRVEKGIYKNIEKIAEEKHISVTQVIEEALKVYQDSYYMKNKATIINEEILKLSQSSMELLEHRINNKTNQVLSELSIQVGIMVQVLASAYQFNPDALDRFRKKSVEFLKINNRVLRLSEIYRTIEDFDDQEDDEYDY